MTEEKGEVVDRKVGEEREELQEKNKSEEAIEESGEEEI